MSVSWSGEPPPRRHQQKVVVAILWLLAIVYTIAYLKGWL